MKTFFLTLSGIAIFLVIVPVINTLYHRLVIRRRTRKHDPFMEDWERHEEQARRMRHGRAPEQHEGVLRNPDGSKMNEEQRRAFETAKLKEQISNRANQPRKPYVQSERKPVPHDYSADRPILYTPHSLWCPTCGGRKLDVKQPGEGSLPTYKCVSCGQAFCVKEKAAEASKAEEPSAPYVVNDDLSEFLSKVSEIAQDEARQIEQNGHWPQVQFGGGDFGGSGAGSSYDSDSSSSPDSDSSSDSGSSDSGSYDSGSSDSSSSND